MRQAVWVAVLCGALVGACGPTGGGDLLGEGDVAVCLTWHDGTPAEGVNVGLSVGREIAVPSGWGVTDAEGRFVWHDVPAGPVRVETDRFDTAFAERETPAPVDLAIELRDDRDVSGVVVDAGDRVVAGAEIVATPPMEHREHVVATTDAHGRFSVRDAHMLLEARAPGHGPSAPSWTPEDRRMRLVLSDTARRLVGRLRGPDGAPVAGARVTVRRTAARWAELHPAGRTARSDADGRFVFEGLPAEVVRLSVSAPGFAPVDQLADLERGDVDVGLVAHERGWTLHGVVTDERGEPVEGAYVTLQDGPRRHTAVTDEDGAYALEDLPARWHERGAPVGVRHSLYVDATSAADEALVARPDAEWNPVLAIGGKIRGVVVDEHGAPASRTAVSVQRGRRTLGGTSTDDEGAFELHGLVDDEYVVVAQRIDDEDSASVAGVRPGAELRLELAPPAAPGRVVGRLVIHSTYGAALSLAALEPSVRRQWARPGDGGSFAFDDVEPGAYVLDLPGWRDAKVLPIDVSVEPDEVTDVGVLVVDEVPGGVVVGLSASDEELLDHAQVDLRHPADASFAADAKRLGDGVHACEDVPAGDYELVVHGDGIAYEALPVTVEPGTQADVVHRLERGGRVDVYAAWNVTSRGADPRALIEVRDEDRMLVYRRVDEVYRTVLEDLVLYLAPGEYTLEIVDEQGRSAWTWFDVVLDHPTTVSVDVR